jgi:CRP-like cAMP-binding protein
MMSVALTQVAAPGNQILTGLSPAKYPQLFSNLKLVRLTDHQVLYHAGDVLRNAYFMTSGMASLLCSTSEAESMEVANIGQEGVVGIPLILRQRKAPHEIVIQIAGEALMVRADILKEEFEKDGELRGKLLGYTYVLSTYMSQLGLCNHFHSLDRRLCRWLLITSHQVRSDTFQLTHESLSQVLGSSRTAVTMAANNIKRQGLIRHHRGQITILDSSGLADMSCACCRIIKKVLKHSAKIRY